MAPRCRLDPSRNGYGAGRSSLGQSSQPPQRKPYFGDLHLHSGYSLDAFALGARVMPDDSFNFAKGKCVPFMGKMVKRKAPLDFLALSDHVEYLGVAPELTNPAGAFVGSGWDKAFNSPTLPSEWLCSAGSSKWPTLMSEFLNSRSRMP